MSRIGQTMLARKGNRPVPIECIRDSGLVHWRSLDLEHAGTMRADTWDAMRKAQMEAIRESSPDVG